MFFIGIMMLEVIFIIMEVFQEKIVFLLIPFWFPKDRLLSFHKSVKKDNYFIWLDFLLIIMLKSATETATDRNLDSTNMES